MAEPDAHVDPEPIHASMRQFIRAELTVVGTDSGYGVRGGDVLVARITGSEGDQDALCETLDGRWRLASPRGTTVVARADGGEATLATYNPV
jgi:hypothetical protein